MRRGVVIAALVLILDQISKWYVVEVVMRPDAVADTPYFAPHAIPITPFFNVVMAWNRGVSFGIFNNDGPHNAWLLTSLSLIIVVALLVWMARTREPVLRFAIGLIVGGALGNAIDRIRFGAVADFLDLHVAGYHWPAFNVADIGISLGAVLLVADALFASRNSHKNTA